MRKGCSGGRRSWLRLEAKGPYRRPDFAQIVPETCVHDYRRTRLKASMRILLARLTPMRQALSYTTIYTANVSRRPCARTSCLRLRLEPAGEPHENPEDPLFVILEPPEEGRAPPMVPRAPPRRRRGRAPLCQKHGRLPGRRPTSWRPVARRQAMVAVEPWLIRTALLIHRLLWAPGLVAASPWHPCPHVDWHEREGRPAMVAASPWHL